MQEALVVEKEIAMSTLETIGEIGNNLSSVPDERQRRWCIVLAGGQGRRMVRWIESRDGAPRPKQFCAFSGSRTMLQHTLERAVQVAPPHNTVTVIAREHRKFLPDDVRSEIPGRVIEQPADRGTAAGVLLPATYVRDRDPEATVLILPSDHYIYPNHRFGLYAERACRLAERFEDRFILLGAVAGGAETDYGWILPERRRPSPVRKGRAYESWPVARFREKPAPDEAARLFDAGGLWNTLVVAVKVKALWTAARRLVPRMIDRFEFLQCVLQSGRAGRLNPRREAEVLREIYPDMESVDFSRDLLQHVAASTRVLPMRDVEWSDWGRPERVEETLQRRISGQRRGGLGSPGPAGPIAARHAPASESARNVAIIGEMS